MEEQDRIDNLLKLYPLEQDIKDNLTNNFIGMKEFMIKATVKYYNISLPEQSCSEIIQLFYFKCIGNEMLFKNIPKFQFGLELIQKYFGEQERIFKNYLLQIAKSSIQRGVKEQELEPYLTHYFEFALKKVYPNQPSILDEVYKNFLDSQK